ncbi:ATP-binding protein [Nocardia sp. NPDC058480]|uniref:ATP-binding protein n=1 Tax=unclassified Nocardia TaxID=2637762 RepID=UPI00364B6776
MALHLGTIRFESSSPATALTAKMGHARSNVDSVMASADRLLDRAAAIRPRVVRMMVGFRMKLPGSRLPPGGRPHAKGLRLFAIALFCGVGAYLSLFAGSAGLSSEARIVVGVAAALVVGYLTSVQVVLALDARTGRPSSSEERTPNQLPRDLLDFTGRNQEARVLARALIRAPKSRNAVLITAISGRGGVGKTVLAVHVAHMVADAFPDGQIYINLRGPEAEALDPYEVLGSLLRELGVSQDAVPISLDDRSRLMRTILGRRRILMLLDNAQSEAQVQPLLPGESTSVVLITSRVRLAALDGITRVRLDVMAADEAIEFLREILGRDRIDREIDTAKKLVELAAYLPLAIRILGARLAADPRRPIEDLVQRLLEQQALLPSLVNGQRAVRATLEISYVALSPQARLLFASLGALSIKAFPDWIFDLLDNRETPITRTGHDELSEEEMIESLGPDQLGNNRFGYHDILREFSEEKLAGLPDCEAVTVATLHAVGGSYAATARAADVWIRRSAPRHNIFPVLQLPQDMQSPAVPLASYARAILWCETELRSSIALASQMLIDECLQHVTILAYSLSSFCEQHSYWREWESLAKCGLSAAIGLNDGPARCLFLFQLGRVHHLLGEWSDAISEFEQSLQFAEQHGLRSLEAASLCAIGKVYQLGDIDAAIPLFEQARAIYLEVGDDHAWGYVTANLADIYHQKSDYDRSLLEFDLALPIFRHHGDDWWEANAGVWIGDVYRGLGEYQTAVERLKSSLATMQSLGDERRGAVARVHLARTYADSGDGRRAMSALGAAVPVLERTADRWWSAMAMIEMGKAQVLLRNPAEALRSWNAALPVIQERANPIVLEDLTIRMDAARAALGHSHGNWGS